MPWVRRVALVFFATTLCGCISHPTPAASVPAEPVAGDIRCHFETLTGSLFKARHGLTDQMKSGLDRQRTALQSLLISVARLLCSLAMGIPPVIC